MDAASAPLGELLANYRGILRELRVRGIVADDPDPTTGYAEVLAAAQYQGSRTSGLESWDVVAGDGTRLLVRATVPSLAGEPALRRLAPIRSWDFDDLLIILFDDSYRVTRAVEVPAAAAEAVASFAPRSNGYVLVAADELLDEIGSDVAEMIS